MNQDSASKTGFWIGVVLLFGAIINHIRKSLVWGHDSWQITEWLINYAGGFVRRGLPGEALYYLSAKLGIQANHIAIAVSLALYLFVGVLFAKDQKRSACSANHLTSSNGRPSLSRFYYPKGRIGHRSSHPVPEDQPNYIYQNLLSSF